MDQKTSSHSWLMLGCKDEAPNNWIRVGPVPVANSNFLIRNQEKNMT